MFFYIPTKIYFEDNVLSKHQKEFPLYGKRAFIVTGKNSAIKSGVLADLLPILERENISWYIFDEIIENPELSIISKGKTVFLDSKCDFIIAVGGGSAIDGGKAISIISANNLEEYNLYDTNKHVKAYPIIAIPTTSGTGSEVTQYSVITNTKTGKKAGFGTELAFPKVSFLDPKYTLSLSEVITRDTTIDALSHLLEGLYSTKFNEFLLPFIYNGVKLIIKNLKPCLISIESGNQSLKDILEYRKALMLASNYGGIVIAHTSTTLQHSIGYPLTTVYGVSHGLANGLVMKIIMDLYEPHISNRIDNLFSYLSIKKSDFFTWLDSLNMKFTYKITDDFINERIEEVMNSRNMALNPCIINKKDIINIYKSIV